MIPAEVGNDQSHVELLGQNSAKYSVLVGHERGCLVRVQPKYSRVACNSP